MTLRLILGTPGSGKAGSAIDAALSACANEQRTMVVVPSGVERARLLREIAARDSGYFLNLDVGVFKDLATVLAGSPAIQRTDRNIERLLLRDALAQHRDLFVEAKQWPGFTKTALRAVTGIRRGKLWGEDSFQRAVGQLPGGSISDWQQLASTYVSLLRDRHLYDDIWFEQAASENLKNGVAYLDAVVVHGFEMIGPDIIGLVEQLAATASVTVTLPWRAGSRVYERAAELRDQWRKRGATLIELEEFEAEKLEFSWLRRELFEAHEQTLPEEIETNSVSFIDCCGAAQEAEEVVRETAKLLADGFNPEDIVVVSASTRNNGDLLLAKFRQAQIPAALQIQRTAFDVPTGRAIYGLLHAFKERDPIALIGVLNAPIFGFDRERIDNLELQLRGLKHGRSEAHWRAALETINRPSLTQLANHGNSAEAFREVIKHLRPRNSGELDLLTGFNTTLTRLERVGHVGIDELLTIVESFQLKMKDRTDSGRVVIAAIDDVRNLSFDAVILHSVHGDAFFAHVDDEDEAPTAARDLMYSAICIARKELRIVRQHLDSSGGELAPSPAWLELSMRLPNAKRRERSLSEAITSPTQRLVRSETLLSIAHAMGEGHTFSNLDTSVLEQLASYKPIQDDEVLTGNALKSVEETQFIGATALETYNRCPAQWLYQRKLRLEQPGGDKTALLEGNILHELMQRIVPLVLDDDLSLSDIEEKLPYFFDQAKQHRDPQNEISRGAGKRLMRYAIDCIEAELEWQKPSSIGAEQVIDSREPQAIAPGLRIDDVEIVGKIDRIDTYGSQVVLHDYKSRSTNPQAGSWLKDGSLQLLIYWLALSREGLPIEPIGAFYRAMKSNGEPAGLASQVVRELGMFSPGKRAMFKPDEWIEQTMEEVRELLSELIADLRSGKVQKLTDSEQCPTYCDLASVCRIHDQFVEDNV